MKLLRQHTMRRFAALIIVLGIFHYIKLSHGEQNDEREGELSDTSTGKHNNHTCAELVDIFSNGIHNFINCASAHAEPVGYCMTCGDYFTTAIVKYNALINNETCRSNLFNQDRLNILELIYLNTVSLWEAGSCSDCYDWVEPSTKSFHQNKSKRALEFFDDLKNFTMCESSHTVGVCVNCVGAYNEVNNLYNIIKDSTKDKFCFDIKDAMNKTRLHWSRDLNCCKDRKSSLTAFIVTSVVLSGVIPFAFYTGFMFFSWRREQQPEPLDDLDPQPSGSSHIASSTIPTSSNLLDLDS